MNTMPLCLVGCGGMGSRHVGALHALRATGMSNLDLVAVCDLREDNALRVADEAYDLLGRRPQVFVDLEDALAHSGAEAFDVVTEVSSHLSVALPLLEAGKHVICEKPLALTVRSGRILVESANRSRVVLATAENYRRDPCNRLAKAVVASGLLGEIFLMREVLVGGSDRILITPWRHLKEKGAIGLDMGVHLTDLIQYFLGPIAQIYGHGFIAEPIRYRQEVLEYDSAAYRDRYAEIPQTVEATGEDSFVATYRMASGAHVQCSYIPSGPGQTYQERAIHGRAGSLEMFRDRSGRSPILHTANGRFAADELAELAGFEMDPLTQALFGNSMEYQLEFRAVDAALIAIELHDFAEAAIGDGRPEVDGDLGVAAVAAVLGAYESGLLGQAVQMRDVLDGTVDLYQRDLDTGLAGHLSRTGNP